LAAIQKLSFMVHDPFSEMRSRSVASVSGIAFGRALEATQPAMSNAKTDQIAARSPPST
jgi:hypothetical protein